MGGKRRVNKAHPHFSEYKLKCEALCLKYQLELDEVEKTGREAYSGWQGRDCPWGEQEREITRRMYAELRDLQKAYGYLFTEGAEDEG